MHAETGSSSSPENQLPQLPGSCQKQPQQLLSPHLYVQQQPAVSNCTAQHTAALTHSQHNVAATPAGLAFCRKSLDGYGLLTLLPLLLLLLLLLQ